MFLPQQVVWLRFIRRSTTAVAPPLQHHRERTVSAGHRIDGLALYMLADEDSARRRDIWSAARVVQERPDALYQLFALDFLPAARLNVSLMRLSTSLASGGLAHPLHKDAHHSCTCYVSYGIVALTGYKVNFCRGCAACRERHAWPQSCWHGTATADAGVARRQDRGQGRTTGTLLACQRQSVSVH